MLHSRLGLRIVEALERWAGSRYAGACHVREIFARDRETRGYISYYGELPRYADGFAGGSLLTGVESPRYVKGGAPG
jgi:hypothetical protein